MRLRWVEVALFATLGFFAVNQYPVFGTTGSVSEIADPAYGVATDWALAYLVAAIGFWLVGVALYAARAADAMELTGDLPEGLVVLGGGAFVASWTLEVAKDAPEELYEIVVALVSALVVLAIVVAATSRSVGPAGDRSDAGPGEPGPGREREEVRMGDERVVVSPSEETVEEPVEGV